MIFVIYYDFKILTWCQVQKETLEKCLYQFLKQTPENRSTNWDLFKQRWNNYEITTGLMNKPEEIKLTALLSTIEEETLIVYNAFNWYQGEEKTVSAVLEKFESYCKPKKNVTYERFLFMSRKQKVGESITDIVALRNLVKNYDYGPLTDSLVRDAIVLGVRNNKTREALLKENDLSLDTCIYIVRANERAYEQMKERMSNSISCLIKTVSTSHVKKWKLIE